MRLGARLRVRTTRHAPKKSSGKGPGERFSEEVLGRGLAMSSTLRRDSVKGSQNRLLP